MSCPGFEGDGTLLTEGSCVWAKVIERSIKRDANGHHP